MESNADIISKIEKKCELIDGHLIWKGTIKNGSARMSFRKNEQRVSTWYYLATNDLPALPENTNLASFCNTRHCLSHNEAISHYECITMLSERDILYFLGKMSFVTEMKGECQLVKGIKIRPDGYVRKNMWGQKWYLHVLTYCIHHGINREDIKQGYEIAHECGKRNCVNIDHLTLKTKSGNAEDRVRHGTASRGEKHGNALMDDNTALKIIASFGNGKTQAQRAIEYKVSKSVVTSIDVGNAWKHLFTDADIEKRRIKKRKISESDGRHDAKRPKITETKEVFFQSQRERIQKNIKIESDTERDNHWIWQLQKTPYSGYGVMTIQKNPWIGGVTAHRVSYQVFNNIELPEDVLVRHDCLRKDCCNPEHLSEGTSQDNADDMVRDGTRLEGENIQTPQSQPL